MSDTILFSLVLTAGFYLLARTLVGACPPNVSLWDAQKCNQFARIHFLPAEQALVSVLTIPLFQIFVKGATYPGLCFAWLISLIFTNVSVYYTGGYANFIWMNFAYSVMMCVSYEFERVVLVNFMNLVLLRRAHEEQQSMRATIDINTKNLSTNVHMISIVSDDINGSLAAAFANMDILQRKLVVPVASHNKGNDIACTTLTTTIHDSLQDISKSVDDLKVLYKIIAPKAVQWQMQDHMRKNKNKNNSIKKREVVFEGDERPSDVLLNGNDELLDKEGNSSSNDDNDDDEDDDDDGICMNVWGEDAELVSIHSSKYSTSRNQQSQQSVASMAVAVPRLKALEGQAAGMAGSLALTGASLEPHASNSDNDNESPIVEVPSPARPYVKLMWDDADENCNDKNEPTPTGGGMVGLGMDGLDGKKTKKSDKNEKKTTIPEPSMPSHPRTITANQVLQKGCISNKTFISNPNPALSFPMRMRMLQNESNVSPSSISSPDCMMSAFVYTRKGGFVNTSSLIQPPPPPHTQSLSLSSSPLTAFSKGCINNHNNDHHVNNMYPMDMQQPSKETVDCRVLSDEIAASLHSPVDVMLPFPSNHMDDNDDSDDDESKDSTEDSIDDGKMGQYINAMATSIATDFLALQHNNKLVYTVEPSPLHLLVRMPPAGPLPPSPFSSFLFPLPPPFLFHFHFLFSRLPTPTNTPYQH